ncbi:sigma factor-like helix-turn-helix DNA-binding protein [Flavobacteriaceae bacterium 3-367]|uniref:RNA polymerase sigma factor n=1 Tax=Eudoraea algarum TaxID=3417568 RepID=UPI00328372AA
MYEALYKLDKIEKEMLLLYLKGLKQKEIAQIMGFTTTNVGTKIGRIKLKLKKMVARQESN